jgi:prepilin-type N-terminal cleavage/methylation domain-containing protein
MKRMAKGRGQQRFTLVELMIVVAIIGLLAAIAVSNVQAMQYKAKRAEISPLLHGISISMIAYESAHDSWPPGTPWEPDNAPGKSMRDWLAPSAFDVIEWRPNGAVRGSYRISTSPADFLAEGSCDVDGNGDTSQWEADKQINVQMITPPDTY